MSFMQPQVYSKDKVYAYTNKHGETMYSTELERSEVGTTIEVLEGYLYRFSAPGYLDCTEFGFAESFTDTIRGLLEQASDCPVDELREIAELIPCWSDYWGGYLIGIAFTATDDNGDSVWGEPGCDIRDCVEPSEVEQALEESGQLGEAIESALSFLLDALDLLDSEEGELESKLADELGSDFHLTRNRHGAGFWDSDWDDSLGKQLTELAHPYGELELRTYTTE